MKAASPAMIALLAQNEMIVADCYTLTLLDSTIYRFTSFDVDLVVGANTFLSTGLIFERGNIKRATGFKVDVMTLDVFSDTERLYSGLPFLQFTHNGGLDGARLLLQRAFMPASAPTDTSAGVIHGFEGSLQINDLTRHGVRMEVRSNMEKLNVMMPRIVYQPTCNNTLFDAACGLSKAAFEVAGSITSNSSDPRSVATNLTNPDGYFSGGTLRFISGANAGALITVLGYAGGVFSLMQPLHGAILTGDNVVACPGCQRSTSECLGKFSNLANYRGQPFIPTPETAI